MLYNSVCLEKYKEKVGHRACSGDMMGQTQFTVHLAEAGSKGF